MSVSLKSPSRKASSGFASGLNLTDLAAFAFAAISSWFLCEYLNIEASLFVWFVLVALEFFAIRCLRRQPLRGKLANILVGLFSALFSLSLILGEHIVVGSSYIGLSDVNYISSYSAIDVCALLFILPGVFSLLAVPVAKVRAKGAGGEGAGIHRVEQKPLGIRWVAALALLVFVLWVPYLVVYWPGFVFPDSLFSIEQALGLVAWTNHHPAAYTAFIKVCLKIASVLGFGHTAGLGLSTAIQMAFMAFGFGYFSRWIVVRGSLKPIFGVVFAVAFGLCSYLGSFSIALWKDPIFSTAGLLLSVCLADLAWSRGKAALQRKWVALFFMSALLLMFLRNNGVFIMALVCLLVVAVILVARIKSHQKKTPGYFVALCSSVLAVVIYAIVSGPGYTALGVVPSEASEAAGVPLNQMARVAALDGDMTESDREYLGSIIPFEEYPNRYYPCCTDNLKWSENFSNEALQDGMWKHWASMLVRNPYVYFQAWELQTFGFWAVNTEKQSDWTINIGHGNPSSTSAEGIQSLQDDYQIYPNLLGTDKEATRLFPMDSWSVPISWLLWISCYLALLLCLSRRPLWALGLIPSIGVALTLLIASPIYYWPRYGAVLQFCIPYFALLFYLLLAPKGGFRLLANDQDR